MTALLSKEILVTINQRLHFITFAVRSCEEYIREVAVEFSHASCKSVRTHVMLATALVCLNILSKLFAVRGHVACTAPQCPFKLNKNSKRCTINEISGFEVITRCYEKLLKEGALLHGRLRFERRENLV